MKHLILTFLYCCLVLLIPYHCTAAISMPGRNHHKQYHYTHPHHFQGRAGNGFTSVFSLTCSIIGSVATVGTIVAAFAAAPATALLLATYGFSLLGIVFGIISHSDSGDMAIVIGLVNLMVLSLAGAIYQATMGNYVPLAKILRGWH